MEIFKVKKSERLRGWFWGVRYNPSGTGPITMYFWDYKNAKEFYETHDMSDKPGKRFFNLDDENMAYNYLTTELEDIEGGRLINC